MSTDLVDLIAKQDDNGNLLITDCTLIVGDGTMKAEFRNGRAKVPANLAPLFAQHPNVECPALDLGVVPPAAPQGAIGVQPAPGEDPEKAALALRVRELEAQLAGGAPAEVAPPAEVPADQPGGEHRTPPGKPEVSEEEKQRRIAAARAYLASQGEDVPEVEKVSEPVIGPPLEVNTGEGEPRCQARKGDGSQCSNAARDETRACGLPAHQQQVATAPVTLQT